MRRPTPASILIFFPTATTQFPGNNELDQIKKIHNVVGTPPPELLQRLKRLSSHMDCNFPPQQGMGIDKLVPHVPAECVDLINR